jgi:Icc-related predicted phosphoesterase
MRLVAVGDTHGHHEGFVVPDGDVFVHAGDMTARGTLDQVRDVRDWIAALPHRHKIIVAGNHDFAFERTPVAARELFAGVAHYLEGGEVVLEGLRVWGGPWQPWFHSWAFNVRRGEAIDTYWRNIPTGLDCLITHGPPLGCGDRIWSGDRVGCADLLRHLERAAPRVHLYGHIHEDPGSWQVGATRCFNVTVADCTRAATVVDV